MHIPRPTALVNARRRPAESIRTCNRADPEYPIFCVPCLTVLDVSYQVPCAPSQISNSITPLAGLVGVCTCMLLLPNQISTSARERGRCTYPAASAPRLVACLSRREVEMSCVNRPTACHAGDFRAQPYEGPKAFSKADRLQNLGAGPIDMCTENCHLPRCQCYLIRNTPRPFSEQPTLDQRWSDSLVFAHVGFRLLFWSSV
jgi:hypothetical protein